MNFKHSGALGDIVYSLPVIKQKYEETGEKQDLCIGIDSYIMHPPKNKVLLLSILFKIPQKIHTYFYRKTGKRPFNITWLYDHFYPRITHPTKDVLLNQAGYDFIRPLLLDQSYIKSVSVYNGQSFDVDLDKFRSLDVNYQDGDIASWHIQATGILAKLTESWLYFEKNTQYKDFIVWGRSSRYRNEVIDYSILKNINNLVFVGLEGEYEDAKKIVPNLIYKKTENAKELASVIGSAKLYIGNGSFAFAIAEGAKVNRLYEECLWCQSVKPKNNAIVFRSQEEFKKALEEYI